MKKLKFPPTLWMTAMIAAVFLGLTIDHIHASSKSDPFYEGLTLYQKVIQKINYGYVEDIDMEAMTRHAIEGALEILDPHTTFFEPRDYEELMVHTEGEFGGLGIQIAIRDEILTIMTPIAGTPAERAGVRSGDKILKIDNVSTVGITLEEAVGKMRGKPGTSVTITIGREGEAEAVDYEIERAIIKIRSVPYVGLFEDTIGYLGLTTFSQDAGEAVRTGVDSLIEMGATSVVFDLRFNPGGLLTQAQSVSSVFLPRNKLVVFTKGRLREFNDSLFTRLSPALPEGMPLVVMVNGASASAAEIVSGAVQDWDRGVVLGDTTFGKGSVQTVLPIDRERHIKLTTAFYYTPSGRCINRPENGIRGDEEDTTDVDSTEVNEEIYYTASGRTVYGGGGVIPDTIIDDKPQPFIVRKLKLKDLFFRFANYIAPTLEQKGTEVDTSFQADEWLVDEFYSFLDSAEFDYSLVAEDKLDDFRVYIGMSEDTTIDSTILDYVQVDMSEEDAAQAEILLAQLDELLLSTRRKELDAEAELIREGIRMAVVVHEIGRDNDYVNRKKLEDDEQFQAALTLIKDSEAYHAVIKAGSSEVVASQNGDGSQNNTN